MNRLLTKVVLKDKNAFIKLYIEASPKLFSLCLRLVNYDKDAAEKILQRTFIEIWENAYKFDTAVCSPIIWMGKIAINHAFDYPPNLYLVKESNYDATKYFTKSLHSEKQDGKTQRCSFFKSQLNNL